MNKWLPKWFTEMKRKNRAGTLLLTSFVLMVYITTAVGKYTPCNWFFIVTTIFMGIGTAALLIIAIVKFVSDDDTDTGYNTYTSSRKW